MKNLKIEYLDAMRQRRFEIFELADQDMDIKDIAYKFSSETPNIRRILNNKKYRDEYDKFKEQGDGLRA